MNKQEKIKDVITYFMKECCNIVGFDAVIDYENEGKQIGNALKNQSPTELKEMLKYYLLSCSGDEEPLIKIKLTDKQKEAWHKIFSD